MDFFQASISPKILNMKKNMLVFAVCFFSIQLMAQTTKTKPVPPPPPPVDLVAIPPPPPEPPPPPPPEKVEPDLSTIVKDKPATPPKSLRLPKMHKASKQKVKFTAPVIVTDAK